MSVLVYCFKLDDNEFNLKSEYKKYKPFITKLFEWFAYNL